MSEVSHLLGMSFLKFKMRNKDSISWFRCFSPGIGSFFETKSYMDPTNLCWCEDHVQLPPKSSEPWNTVLQV